MRVIIIVHNSCKLKFQLIYGQVSCDLTYYSRNAYV